MLADEGVYLASESSFTCVLRAHGQTAHRGRAEARNLPGGEGVAFILHLRSMA